MLKLGAHALPDVGLEVRIMDTGLAIRPGAITVIVKHDKPGLGGELGRDRLGQIDLIPEMPGVGALPLAGSHAADQLIGSWRERQVLRRKPRAQQLTHPPEQVTERVVGSARAVLVHDEDADAHGLPPALGPQDVTDVVRCWRTVIRAHRRC
ncbi:MAG TPA: hypothetical protein VH165_12750, partial [Kofleriaceae bacterium]|nr:hypothetical protein [Kofleriaceae bacterium]